MNLKKVLVGASLLVSLNSFSQDLKFNVYTNGVNFLGYRPKVKLGSVKREEDKLEASFLFGSYNFSMEQVNDSIYKEEFETSFPFESRKEEFLYLKSDSGYELLDYRVLSGQRRPEKDSIFMRRENLFLSNYKTALEVFDDLNDGELNDSSSFFLMAVPYSVPFNKINGRGVSSFYADLKEFVDGNQDDAILFDGPLEIKVKKFGKDKGISVFSSEYRERGKNIRTRVYGERVY